MTMNMNRAKPKMLRVIGLFFFAEMFLQQKHDNKHKNGKYHEA